MGKSVIEDRGDVAILRLNNGVTNAIDPALLDDLDTSLQTIKETYRGLVLAGGTRFFSIGFDLPQLLRMNRDAMTAFFDKFNHIAFQLFTLPLPAACAIAGHAIAGGNILALTCDYRFAAAEEKQIGLNEIRLGLPVPHLADLMLRQIIGDRKATEMIYSGRFITLETAEGIGLIDERIPLSDLDALAADRVAELAAFMQPAFAAIKANRVEAVCRQYKRDCLAKRETFLDCWFNPSTQALLQAAVEKF